MKAMAFLRKKYRPARRQTGQEAWIGIHGSFATRQCSVIDLSESGAKIRVDDPAFVRPEFHLKFSRVDPGRRCRIVWRKGSLIGIAFA
jgi:hypothetical protein